MQARNNSSGRWLVAAILIGGLALAIIALFYRNFPARVPNPATTAPTTSSIDP